MRAALNLSVFQQQCRKNARGFTTRAKDNVQSSPRAERLPFQLVGSDRDSTLPSSEAFWSP